MMGICVILQFMLLMYAYLHFFNNVYYVPLVGDGF